MRVNGEVCCMTGWLNVHLSGLGTECLLDGQVQDERFFWFGAAWNSILRLEYRLPF